MLRKSKNARIQLLSLAFALTIALAACSGAADTAAPEGDAEANPAEQEPAAVTELETEAEPEAEAESVEADADADAEPATPPQFTIEISAGEISVPEGIPSGLVEVIVDNVDSEWHSAIIRQLNDGVTVEDFGAAFQQEPKSTMPLTTFVGGPDVPGETTISGFYSLDSGTYVLVDNWVEPWRFISFEVNGETIAAAAKAPEAGVNVLLNEYAIEMPETLPAGSQLWQYTNDGQFPHNVGFIRLTEGQSVDDLAAWMGTQQGPPPFEYFGMWNIVSPGVTSWGELELASGDYLAVDMMPDFASEGGWNVEQGMFQTFTVTS